MEERRNKCLKQSRSRGECSRRDVPKIKMHLRGNLIWVTILVSLVAELVIDEELNTQTK